MSLIFIHFTDWSSFNFFASVFADLAIVVVPIFAAMSLFKV